MIHEEKTDTSAGVELRPLSHIALRAGYTAALFSKAGPSLASRLDASASSAFAGGLGLSLSRYQIDYSYTPTGELVDSQRITMSIRF